MAFLTEFLEGIAQEKKNTAILRQQLLITKLVIHLSENEKKKNARLQTILLIMSACFMFKNASESFALLKQKKICLKTCLYWIKQCF